MEQSSDKWGAVQVPEKIRRELIKQILTGTVHRDEFPDLWPEKILILINWPEQ